MAKTGEVGKLYIKLANQRVSTFLVHDSWERIKLNIKKAWEFISGSQSSIFLNIRTLSCNLILHHHLVFTSPMHYLMKCPFQLQILCCKMLLIVPNGPSIMVMRFVTDIIFKSYDHCCDQEHNISPSNDTHCLIHCTDQLVIVLGQLYPSSSDSFSITNNTIWLNDSDHTDLTKICRSIKHSDFYMEKLRNLWNKISY